jgi:hypothetical protein
MFESLLKHQQHLEQAVADDDFSRFAKTARGGLDSQSAVLEAGEQLNEIVRLLSGGEGVTTSMEMLANVANNKRFSTVYKAVRDPKFWKAAQPYVNLNKPVAAAITNLSGDSVCLSDAVYLVMTAGKSMHAATCSQYCELFSSEHQVAALKHLWDKRSDHLTGFAHLSHLLDPRRRYRKFVQSERLIVGSVQEKDYGNTAFLVSAGMCLRNMADVIFTDLLPTVLERKQKMRDFSLIEVKQAILSGALKAFIGVHEKRH